jgi:chlorophyll synthase
MKPVTWFPPMWAFACGVVSTGLAAGPRALMIATGVVLAGPLVCGTSQMVNDWYDRHVDAINEPQRPIPSGRLPGTTGFWLGVIGTVISALVGATLGRAGLIATLVGLAMAWAYSAPPLRFKANGWLGNLACGISYEGVAWVTGAAVMLGGAVPSTPTLLLALLYSAGAHGIMTLNDFKAIEGDRVSGVRSLPVLLGEVTAAKVASLTILFPQLIAIGLLFRWGHPGAATTIACLCVFQVAMMFRFIDAPREKALWYSALGVPLSVLGMMVCAVAISHGVRG